MEQADLNAAHVFIEVVRQGSFTNAARALDLPKSTVSRKVSELETRLGARLLERTTRQLRLTDVGAVYFERVQRAVAEVAEAEIAVADAQGIPRGVLRVTAPPDLGMTVLAWAIPEFARLHPEVEVVLDLSGRTIDLVGEGFDVAIRASALGDSSLVAKALGTSGFGLFASPSYLSERGRPETVADLAKHDCLVFGSTPERSWSFESEEGPLSVVVRGRVSIKDFAYLRVAAVAGAGIVLLPEITAVLDEEEGRLVRLFPQLRTFSSALHIAYPSRQFLPAKTRAFVDFMVSTFQNSRERCRKKAAEFRDRL